MNPQSLFSSEFLNSLGVLDWGYTEESIPRTFTHFEKWVEDGLHRPLGYLADHRKDLRSDVKKVYPSFQSALVFLFSYQETKKWMLEHDQHQVAAYALGFGGEDYHRALKGRLEAIANSLSLSPEAYYTSLDTSPVLERDLAYRAGLGWFGKNSMLIHQKEGSYFIIGSLLLKQKLPLPAPVLDVDHCGQCVACVDACPTNAIDPTRRTLIAERCISTFTIELFKDAKPPEGFDNSRGEIFGCDICQDVCPWNRKPLGRTVASLNLKERFSFVLEWFIQWPKEKLQRHISQETNRSFRKKLSGTAFDRPGREGWLKNLK